MDETDAADPLNSKSRITSQSLLRRQLCDMSIRTNKTIRRQFSSVASHDFVEVKISL